MPEANLARLGSAVPMVVSRVGAVAPGADLVLALLLILSPARPGPMHGGGALSMAMRAPTRLEPTPIRHGLGSPGWTAPDAPGAGCAVVAPCRWPCDYLVSLRTASHSLDTGNGTLFSGKISPKCILRGYSDGKKAFPRQDNRGMYSPATFFTAFHGSNHT